MAVKRGQILSYQLVSPCRVSKTIFVPFGEIMADFLKEIVFKEVDNISGTLE